MINSVPKAAAAAADHCCSGLSRTRTTGRNQFLKFGIRSCMIDTVRVSAKMIVFQSYNRMGKAGRHHLESMHHDHHITLVLCCQGYGHLFQLL